MPSGRAGQGKIDEADTVNIVPTKVRKKRDDNAERRVGDDRRNWGVMPGFGSSRESEKLRLNETE